MTIMTALVSPRAKLRLVDVWHQYGVKAQSPISIVEKRACLV